MTQSNQPVFETKFGAVKATVWENQNEKGPRHTIDLYRIYKDAEGQWQRSNRFAMNYLPKLEKAAAEAYRELHRLGAQSLIPTAAETA